MIPQWRLVSFQFWMKTFLQLFSIVNSSTKNAGAKDWVCPGNTGPIDHHCALPMDITQVEEAVKCLDCSREFLKATPGLGVTSHIH